MSEPCIFIVDDDDDIRASLSRALRTRGYKTEVFASAQAFLDSDAADRPGCMILDYGLPGMTGLELQKHLLERGSRLPVIFITGHGGVSEAVQAMKYGAVDFLEKPFRQEKLIERIEAALAQDARSRQSEESSRAARIRLETLTDREHEIARFLVSNPAQSSSKEVARHLNISPRTVDHHRARILDKMNVASVADLVNLCIAARLFEDAAPVTTDR
ncbi:response regulator [uncultured Roseobacter sp.]|uniref:response regulator transcription factor n=1 Tax=uncultured Roseobacter sp. TaxID=114847 RepID=UPI0034599882